MDQLFSKFTTPPAQQASNILKAWVCYDESALRKELNEGLKLCSSAEAFGLEEENIELLKTVVLRLDECPALNTERADPVVRLCMNLLMHLAGRPAEDCPTGAAAAY